MFLFLQGATSETDFGGSIGQQAHAESPLRVLPAGLGNWRRQRNFPNHLSDGWRVPTCDGASLWGQRAAGAVKAVALHRLTGWEDFFRRQLD